MLVGAGLQCAVKDRRKDRAVSVNPVRGWRPETLNWQTRLRTPTRPTQMAIPQTEVVCGSLWCKRYREAGLTSVRCHNQE